ncbi:glycoside hydrolase family 15 protein [Lichenihabitans sp. Uapishka_5]|uniref:glycoside hydrolase family 15 protein n=1 Tax=Lichenihabitans sp. Uapishka_5 TaxID=3037302 RepID=UPI0029E7CC75|nr:glycoside hydrolase family 15 protein [Lichenihabitans sp. Uapishka_5]MDX7949875.1 glycoside hydrolase family 15 protein [Lichenihabitans sp. Uapishka_5]
MALRIEDYALIGNCEGAGLVGRNGSIDWLGLPRFDSAAFFAALLGNQDNGYWRIAPVDETARVTRQYRKGTLVLETTFETDAGTVVLTDCMGRREGHADVARQLRCTRGSVAMQMTLCVRFDYGLVVPWASRLDDGRLSMIAGPDRLVLDASVPLRGENMTTVADFTLNQDEEQSFTLNWSASHRPLPARHSVGEVIERATWNWREWSKGFKAEGSGEWADLVLRSLITLKALTHFETGGIVAAATTSLPEQLGGSRNWDYRYCWLRDATLTLYALVDSGFLNEAVAWRAWLLRAIAGSPAQMQIMYGVAGERRLDEFQIDWLSGYEGSKPVRVGNAASGQLQLDVFGEVLGAMYQARCFGMDHDVAGWQLEKKLIEHLDGIWRDPDEGIWEVRGGRRQFTHSKVMAWLAYTSAIKSVEEFGLDGPVEQWRKTRDEIHQQVCDQGFDKALNSFTQSYGAKALDASLLLIPIVGFLPPDDPRVIGTVKAIEGSLLHDGFVARYDTGSAVDGLSGGEGTFLPCSFWLVDVYTMMDRRDEAQAMFKRLVGYCNDVGLISEEFDVSAQRLVGNFPQAFTHVGLINSVHNLERSAGPARHRAKSGDSA